MRRGQLSTSSSHSRQRGALRAFPRARHHRCILIDLPIEILLNVCAFCDPRTVSSLSCTCRVLHHIVRHSPFIRPVSETKTRSRILPGRTCTGANPPKHQFRAWTPRMWFGGNGHAMHTRRTSIGLRKSLLLGCSTPHGARGTTPFLRCLPRHSLLVQETRFTRTCSRRGMCGKTSRYKSTVITFLRQISPGSPSSPALGRRARCS